MNIIDKSLQIALPNRRECRRLAGFAVVAAAVILIAIAAAATFFLSSLPSH